MAKEPKIKSFQETFLEYIQATSYMLLRSMRDDAMSYRSAEIYFHINQNLSTELTDRVNAMKQLEKDVLLTLASEMNFFTKSIKDAYGEKAQHIPELKDRDFYDNILPDNKKEPKELKELCEVSSEILSSVKDIFEDLPPWLKITLRGLQELVDLVLPVKTIVQKTKWRNLWKKLRKRFFREKDY